MAATRPAKKAGTWYEKDATALKSELEDYLEAVPDSIDGAPVPIPGARVVIAPHAGYSYSGPCAAWAYKTLDLSRAKRVFVLGPSHTYYLEGCAATTFGKYATPFGDLTIDQKLAKEIQDTAELENMPQRNEVSEHSLEMHMPYLYLRCEQTFGSPDKFPKIVPMLVGSNSGPEEKMYGKVLLPYLKDPENAFIISSDFCHWGDNFSYLVYSPNNTPENLITLRESDRAPTGPPIHETIRVIDEAAMDAVKSGSHDAFLATLRQTRNTVCGRHPIGVMMAALELLAKEPEYEGKGRFSVIQYNRSNLVERPSDMSVSYVSAYAVL
ncbi:MEMO1 family [Fusarium tricinctum]|uniref:MEMO1 family n=1 Tax=Fusarium tricinctum TaxID=61284 RepID=A0A8K0S7X5_9HYPO|nr:MEMO1 family [Fusarium tricinctum]